MRRTLVGLALTLSLAACSQSTLPGLPAPTTGANAGTTLTKQDVVTVTPGANDIVTSGKVTKAPGQQGAPQISLTATNDDQQNGCNATGNAKATLTMTSSNTAVIAQPAPIQIAGCGTTVSFPYTVASDAPEGAEVLLTVKASGGRGGSYTEASFTVRVIHPKPVDSTGPVVTPTIRGTAGLNGWYTSDVTVQWAVEDLESAVSTPECASTTVMADTTGQDVTCTATSAGGTTIGKVAVKRDTATPTVTAAPDRAPNVAGWYREPVTFTFTCADATPGSGLADGACPAPLVVSSESDGSAPAGSGSITDRAGLSGNTTVSVKLDRTAPTATITPQGTLVNGWYTSDVTFAVAGTDALSGGVTCTPIAALTSDTAGQDVSTTCTDAAGNSRTAQLVVKRDATAPTSAEISPSGSFKNGWYTSDVIFSVSGTDALSAVTCTAIPVLSADTDGTTVQSVCTDQAGNSTPASLSGIKRDTHAPVISGTLDSRVIASSSAGATLNSSMMSASDKTGTLNGSGVSEGVSNGVTCTPTALKFGDNTVTCTATDNAGNTASRTFSVSVTLDNIFSSTFNLLAPLKSNPADLSLVKQGSTVPVKFTAPSYAGGPATDLAGGLVMKITYRSSATSDTTFEVVDAAASGSTVWRYDATSNQYIFNLSTKAGFAQAGQYDIEISFQGVIVARGAFNLKK